MKNQKGGSLNMKELVLEVTKKMPDDASLEEIVDAIIVEISIKKGLTDFKNGRYTSQEDLLKEIDLW